MASRISRRNTIRLTGDAYLTAGFGGTYDAPLFAYRRQSEVQHKIYLLIISLLFLVGMVGLQACFEGQGYGYGSCPAYPADELVS